MRRTLIFVFFAIWISSVSANDHIHLRVDDPKQLIPQMDDFLGPVPFEQAFPGEEKSTYEVNRCSYECAQSRCSEKCRTFQAVEEVIQVTANEATIQTTWSDSIVSTASYPKVEYERLHGNILRLFLSLIEKGQIPSFPGFSGRIGPKDFVVIDGIQDAPNVLPSGQKVARALEVNFTLNVWFEEHHQHYLVPFYLVLASGQPVLSQLMVFGFHDRSLKPAVRLLSYQRRQ